MLRPTTKKDLIIVSKKNYEKLNLHISMIV